MKLSGLCVTKATAWPAETSYSQSTVSRITSSKRVIIICSHHNITCPSRPIKFGVPDTDSTIWKSQCVLHISPIWNSLKKTNYIYCLWYILLAPFFLKHLTTSGAHIFITIILFCCTHKTVQVNRSHHKCRLITGKERNSMIEKSFLRKRSAGLIWPFFSNIHVLLEVNLLNNFFKTKHT
jgi:hypothetical protein